MTFTPINKGQFTLEPVEREAAFERNRGYGVEEDYAANRKRWSEYPKAQLVSDYPLHVDLELASICNLRCPMCYTISEEFRHKVNAKLMDYELFTRLVDECAAGGVYSIRLSFRGESFLHPRIIDCTRYAKSKGIREVSSLTNGVRIDEAMFTEMMEAGIDWITFSIDGTGKVYEEIRRPSKFDRMVEKLGNFKKIKAAAGRVKPVIKVQSILPAIEKDPQEFYSIFAPIADMVSANPLIDFMEDKRSLPKIADFTCPQIFQRLVIGADGLCMMCSNDESGDHIVGDVNKQTIHEVWHGAEMAKVRELHKRHQACSKIEACGKCYLPLQTYESAVSVGGRPVIAEKYVSATQTVDGLNTPARWKRQDLGV